MAEQEDALQQKMYAPLALLLAIEQTQELEVKHGLMEEKELHIKNQAAIFEKELAAHFQKVGERFTRAGKILQENLAFVLPEEKALYEKDLSCAFNTIAKLGVDANGLEDRKALFTANTLQEFLRISDESLLWIYSVGYNLFKEKCVEDAYAIFHLLLSLNSTTCDYWIAMGFTQLEKSEDMQALHSFATASLLDEKNPISRYQSAVIYLRLNQLEDALEEIKALEEIVAIQNLDNLKSSVVSLKSQIELQKNSVFPSGNSL
jgi:hypothetical protein